MATRPELIALTRVSRELGRNRDLVQAGGGNTSLKIGSTLHIKASGLRLRDLDGHTGLVAVDLPALRDLLADAELAAMEVTERDATLASRLAQLTTGPTGHRASIETWVHAVFGPCVVHTHPVAVNAIGCTARFHSITAELFRPFPHPPLVCDYATPGYPLARELAQARRQYLLEHRVEPQNVVLANHGLITVGDSPAEAGETTLRVVELAARRLDAAPEPQCTTDVCSVEEVGAKHPGLTDALDTLRIRMSLDPWVRSACRHPRARSWFCDPPLFPDQVVYGGPSALWLEEGSDASAAVDGYTRQFGVPPRVIATADVGVMLAGPTAHALDATEEVLSAHLRVSEHGERLGELQRLSLDAVGYLMNWNAEHFRQQVTPSGP